ncbi:MAG TPA: hypothetical protein VHO68_00665, partial [Bacteroidales bacterium]|nr:hypothetical protein [Bacteroidales bacterium]
NANRMMELLDNSPYDFVMNSGDDDLERLEKFVHRKKNSCVFTVKRCLSPKAPLYLAALKNAFAPKQKMHQVTRCLPIMNGAARKQL